jgi:hypothetical protein
MILFDSEAPLAVAVRAVKWPLLTASLFRKKKLIGYSQKDKRIFDVGRVGICLLPALHGNQRRV